MTMSNISFAELLTDLKNNIAALETYVRTHCLELDIDTIFKRRQVDIYRIGDKIDRVTVGPELTKPKAQPVASTQSHQLDNTIRFEATTAGMEKITHHIKRLSQRVDELENKK